MKIQVLNRVYITGIGTLLGSVKDSYSNGFVVDDVVCNKIISKYQTRLLDRISKLLLAAADLSLIDSGLKLDKNEGKEYGLFLGTQYGALNTIHSFDSQAVAKGALTVNPTEFPNTVLNAPACQVGLQMGITGPIYTICNGTNASLDSIGLAYNHIKTGHMDAVLAGGADEISELQAKIHNTDESVYESSSFLVLETSEDMSNLDERIEIIGYHSQSIPCKTQLNYTEFISSVIRNFLRSMEIRINDIACIRYYITKDLNNENLMANIVQLLNYNGLCLPDYWDYMGAVGIVQVIKSVQEMRKNAGKGIIYVILNLSMENISILIIKKH